MIYIIYGAKGTGKTKRLIDRANTAVMDGEVVFITDTDKYNFSIKHKVRLINATDYHVVSEQGLLGFISGMVAGNSDIQHIYIDGSHRICGEEIAEMEYFYNNLGDFAEKANVDITLAVSEAEENLPDFIKKYM